MADISKEQLNEVLARVMGEVTSESEAARREFSVPDLQTHAGALGKIGQVAWTISYSTASGSVLDRVTDRLDKVAWTISYSTASGNVLDRVSDRTTKG